MNKLSSHIPVEARLFRDKALIGTCRAMYLGLLGTVLDAAPGELPIGMALEIQLRLAGEGRLPVCRLDAVVSQHSRLGVGLTFRHPGKQECNELREMIYESWRCAATPRRARDGRRPTAIAWQAEHGMPKAGY